MSGRLGESDNRANFGPLGIGIPCSSTGKQSVPKAYGAERISTCVMFADYVNDYDDLDRSHRGEMMRGTAINLPSAACRGAPSG